MFPVLISALLPIPISAILLSLIALIEEIPIFLTSISDWGSLLVPTPIFAGNPTTCNKLVTVAIPIEAKPLLTEFNVIVPVETKLDAVVAVPVRLPTKLEAVTIPVILMLDGIDVLGKVPEDILEALIDVRPAPDPEKDDAVMIPDTFILDGKRNVFKVPDEILEAFSDCNPAPDPLNETAVAIPLEYKFP